MSHFGLWKEYGWVKGASSISEDIPVYQEDEYQTDKRIIDYLESGIPILGLRSIVVCFFTKQDMGSAIILTDGSFAWTKQYIHYLKKGVIELDSTIELHIIGNDYQHPSREQIGMEQLRLIQGNIRG